MLTEKKSRRDFLINGSSVFGASWMALNMPLLISAAQAAGETMATSAAFKSITASEAVVIASVVDLIIPKDESPSASEIGVVHFIDAALGGFLEDTGPVLRQGLADLETRARSFDSESKGFSHLPIAQQEQVLQSIEDTQFFGTLHFMTMCGMFCLPEYGGNRDHAGWELLGFDHRHAWQPPFGYYDAAVRGGVAEGGETNEQG